MDEISSVIGITPSEEDMKAALKDNGRYTFKIGTLVSLVCKSDPVPLGGNTLTQFQQGLTVPFNFGLKYLEEALDILIKELRAAVKAGEGVLPKGAPKVGSYFVPFCIPWIDRLFRENGVATTFSQTLTPSQSQMNPARYNETPYMSFAETWLKMPLGQNMGYEVESMVEKVKTNKPDGMLMGFFDFDRWLGAHQKMAADLVKEVEKRDKVFSPKFKDTKRCPYCNSDMMKAVDADGSVHYICQKLSCQYEEKEVRVKVDTGAPSVRKVSTGPDGRAKVVVSLRGGVKMPKAVYETKTVVVRESKRTYKRDTRHDEAMRHSSSRFTSSDFSGGTMADFFRLSKERNEGKSKKRK